MLKVCPFLVVVFHYYALELIHKKTNCFFLLSLPLVVWFVCMSIRGEA